MERGVNYKRPIECVLYSHLFVVLLLVASLLLVNVFSRLSTIWSPASFFFFFFFFFFFQCSVQWFTILTSIIYWAGGWRWIKTLELLVMADCTMSATVATIAIIWSGRGGGQLGAFSCFLTPSTIFFLPRPKEKNTQQVHILFTRTSV